ncbi:MAG: hypothetical protein ACK53L_12945 [Pirellulaceae bacterium]
MRQLGTPSSYDPTGRADADHPRLARTDASGPYHQLAILADRQISGNAAIQGRRTGSLADASGWDDYG